MKVKKRGYAERERERERDNNEKEKRKKKNSPNIYIYIYKSFFVTVNCQRFSKSSLINNSTIDVA